MIYHGYHLTRFNPHSMEIYKDIDKLDGIAFEDLVEKLISKMGFITERTKRSFDGGIDIVAINEQPLFDGKYIIQCKRYSKSIGEPILRDLYGVVNSEHANKGILITNSYFTKTAKEFAKNKPVELIDGKKLTNMLDKYLDFYSEKKIGELKIPETYKATVNLLVPVIKEIEDRRRKIKNGLIFVDKKYLENDKIFFNFLQKKQSTLFSLIQTMANQINHIYVLWEKSKGENENYSNLSEIKIHCGEFARSMQKMEKEWEEFFSIKTSEKLHRLHDIACNFYEVIFIENERIILELEKAVTLPDNFIPTSDIAVSLSVNYEIGKPAEEFDKELKVITKSNSGFNWNADSCGGCLIVSAIILAVVFIIAIF